MKEHPILFSGPMVQAILDGRKTMTRRVIKMPKWAQECNEDYEFEIDDDIPYSICKKTGCLAAIDCPYGFPGDRLWVRETFCKDLDHNVFYKADNMPPWEDTKWKPSIFMPRWASRITLEITNVRVERLQEISGKDILAEGLDVKFTIPGSFDALERFHGLWDSINGKKYPWSSNPWVWVIEFKRI